jgi:hypothetical protein
VYAVVFVIEESVAPVVVMLVIAESIDIASINTLTVCAVHGDVPSACVTILYVFVV